MSIGETNSAEALRMPAPVTDYDWAELQRNMYANLGRFHVVGRGISYEDLLRRLGPLERGTFALEVEGTETGVNGLRFRYVDRLKKATA